MKTYRLNDKDTLTLSIDSGAWQTVEFRKSKFDDIGKATAGEIAAVLKKVAGLKALTGKQDELVLTTESAGEHASLEIDPSRSSAAAALGLVTRKVRGSGVGPAQLTGTETAPFKIAAGDKLSLAVDGSKHRVPFKAAVTPGKASAEEVAKAIDAVFKGCCHATHDGRVVISSQSIGPLSAVEIFDVADSRKAARALGFTAGNALSKPYPTAPATLSCGGEPCLCVVNLTSQPIELHLPGGPLVLGREATPVSAVQAGTSRLRRLHERGLIRFKSM